MSLTTMPAPPPRVKEAVSPSSRTPLSLHHHPYVDATEYAHMDNGIDSLFPHQSTATNIIDVLSAAAQHCVGPKALAFRRLNVEFASSLNRDNKYSKKPTPTAMDCPHEDDWELVDFERVFSKTPGLGGVLENCEIQFRSAPDSPVEQLVDCSLNNVSKLNDHPFEFRSKETSCNNTAPGTPVPPGRGLRVPSILQSTVGAQASQVGEPASLSPATSAHVPVRRRTVSGRELDLTTPPRQTARRRNTSTSSTLSDFDGDDISKKNAKLEKNRQSARDCRKRKKEYINSLEQQGQEIFSSIESLKKKILERDDIIVELLEELRKANPRYVRSEKVKAWRNSSQACQVTMAAITTPLKRRAKKQGGDDNNKRAKQEP